jgi:hypothetical protein
MAAEQAERNQTYQTLASFLGGSALAYLQQIYVCQLKIIFKFKYKFIIIKIK